MLEEIALWVWAVRLQNHVPLTYFFGLCFNESRCKLLASIQETCLLVKMLPQVMVKDSYLSKSINPNKLFTISDLGSGVL